MWDSLPYRVKANTQQENRSVSQACGELISWMPSKGVAEEKVFLAAKWPDDNGWIETR